MLDKWDKRFLEMAELVATWSKDPFTKVGAVIVAKDRQVVSTGYNGLPSLVADLDDLLYNRQLKNAYSIHAEINAILNAAKNGVGTSGCRLYSNFFPCTDCLKSIINSGIICLISPRMNNKSNNPLWADKYQESLGLLRAAGAVTEFPDDTLIKITFK